MNTHYCIDYYHIIITQPQNIYLKAKICGQIYTQIGLISLNHVMKYILVKKSLIKFDIHLENTLSTHSLPIWKALNRKANATNIGLKSKLILSRLLSNVHWTCLDVPSKRQMSLFYA